MSINKQFFLDPTGLDTLLEEIFSTISDHYIRQEVVDSELDATSTNPVQNGVITSALNDKIDRVVGQPGQVLMYNSNGEIIAADVYGYDLHRVQSISVTTPPNKCIYHSFESFDPTGMVVEKHLTDGTSIILNSNEYTITPLPLRSSAYRTEVVVVDNGEIFRCILPIVVDVQPISVQIPQLVAPGVAWDDDEPVNAPIGAYDSTYISVSGDTFGTTPGTYSTTFTLKYPGDCQWSDGTTAAKNLSWRVGNVYGFELDLDESDPNSNIGYIADNSNYDSAYMDYTNDVFDYGDWADAWFIKGCKPCILNFDGTVECYLDPDDYTKDIDGNSVDIDEDCVGNVMVEIPTVWIKVDTTNSRKPKFYFAETQLDSTYHAYAHTNVYSHVVPYTYVSTYTATYYSSKNRSIVNSIAQSDFSTKDQYYNEHITRSNNLNSANFKGWSILSYSERMMITLLLMLIGKSTDLQTVFGNGVGTPRHYTYNSGTGTWENTSTDALPNDGYSCTDSSSPYLGFRYDGSMNTKGLFWGSSDYRYGVKVFGIENFWGNAWTYSAGLLLTWDRINGDGGLILLPYKTIDQDFFNSSTTADLESFDDQQYIKLYDGIPMPTQTSASNYHQPLTGDSVRVNEYGLIPYNTTDEVVGGGLSSAAAQTSSSQYFCDLWRIHLNSGVEISSDTLFDSGTGYVQISSYGGTAFSLYGTDYFIDKLYIGPFATFMYGPTTSWNNITQCSYLSCKPYHDELPEEVSQDEPTPDQGEEEPTM